MLKSLDYRLREKTVFFIFCFSRFATHFCMDRFTPGWMCRLIHDIRWYLAKTLLQHITFCCCCCCITGEFFSTLKTQVKSQPGYVDLLRMYVVCK